MQVTALIEKCCVVFQSAKHVRSSHRVRRSRSTSEEFIVRVLLLKVVHRGWLLNRDDQIRWRRRQVDHRDTSLVSRRGEHQLS